jgi:hypothetical protein
MMFYIALDNLLPYPSAGMAARIIHECTLYLGANQLFLFIHRLNMELAFQSLFGIHVTGCAQLYSLDETRNSLPPSAFGLVLRGRYWSIKIDDISL